MEQPGTRDTPRHHPDRPPPRAQRQEEAVGMIALLGRALATQVERLARDGGTAPDGWWFTPDPHR